MMEVRQDLGRSQVTIHVLRDAEEEMPVETKRAMGCEPVAAFGLRHSLRAAAR